MLHSERDNTDPKRQIWHVFYYMQMLVLSLFDRHTTIHVSTEVRCRVQDQWKGRLSDGRKGRHIVMERQEQTGTGGLNGEMEERNKRGNTERDS